ncbi:MAG: aspartate aminotransferase family protein [Bacteroidota bacterium]|nr:aspartate aminotransferase family protein [Bacteroidota bacterium]
MPGTRELFLRYLAQTSDSPIGLEIEKAEGVYLYGKNGKKYIDLISGISVSNLGHRHPAVVKAIKDQVDKYMHLMVYGEYIQAPQVQLAQLLAENLPSNLSCTYFVNSGSEAVEGALKLAKRYTGKSEIIAFKNAYHGSSHGSLSVMGNENFKNSYRPLLPDVKFLEYNDIEQLDNISSQTACVIAEAIQGEAGVIVPTNEFLSSLRNKCNETGALLIIDEVQTGFGRTGTLFGFQQTSIVPDIICIAKGMGGGLPIGAFISSKEIMSTLSFNPILGHITTFGGNPVCCASSLAVLQTLLNGNIINDVKNKEKLIREKLKHPKIKSIRGRGLLLAVEFEKAEFNLSLITKCIQNGVIVDWFLFADNFMRIVPPLTISIKEIENACEIIIKVLNEFS